MNLDSAVYFLATILIFLCCNLSASKPWRTPQNAVWPVIVSFPVMVFVYRLLLYKYPEGMQRKFFMFDRDDLIFGALTFTISTIIYIGQNYFLDKAYKSGKGNPDFRMYHAFLPVAAIIPLHSVWLELANIINIRFGLVINKPFLMMAVIGLLALVLSFVRYRKAKPDTGNKIDFKYYYLFMIIGVAMMAAQPWSIMEPKSEFFESANHGLSIDHFFRYGMLPIVETFDAHMLSNQLPGYIYGILNGYEPWAPFLYIEWMAVPAIIIGYVVLAKLMGSQRAFLLSICFPFIELMFNHYIFAGLAAITLLRVIKVPSIKNYYYFWLSLLFLCLFRLDLGYAALLGAVVAYFTAMYVLKRNYNIKRFTISAVVVFGSALLLFSLLCVIKGVNPAARLSEFLLIAMSNQNWAFVAMGDQTSMLFRILYYLLPITAVILLLSVVGRTVVRKNHAEAIIAGKMTTTAFVFFLFFTFTYFFNLQRGVVRHSLLFDMVNQIAGTVLLALVCFLILRLGRKSFPAVVFISLAFAIALNMKGQVMPTWYKSGLSSGINSPSHNHRFTDQEQFNGSRVRVRINASEFNAFKDITELLLAPGETYFDFSSNNYYHALTGRKNPLYVNQSPLLLNGDKSQEIALQQIIAAKPPMVLMPSAASVWKQSDGIPVDFKYYKLSEYIYKNYVPLKMLESCEVYVIKSRKKSFTEKMKQYSANAANGSFILPDFKGFNAQNLSKHDIDATYKNNRLFLTPAGGDPFIYNLGQYFELSKKLTTDNPVKMVINAEATTSTQVQVFYILPGQTEFKEENSARFTAMITPTDMQIDFPVAPVEFRIDIDGGSVQVNSLAFHNTATNVAATQEILQEFDLGNIPRLWAEFSNFPGNNISEVSEPAMLTTASVHLEESIKDKVYLYIDMESSEDYNARVDIANKDNVKKLGLRFLTKKGRHTYAIRLSSNKYWWQDNIRRAIFATDKAVKIYKLAIISDSGKVIKAGLDGSMALSDITDDNWQGGVSTQRNVLLMNNTLKLQQALKTAKYIELKDGRKLTIVNSNEAGNYININVNEDVGAYRELAAYPNPIKIVQ